mmetsp:Transcript_48729/g.139364  ORF Transcript_48729/g.139364 Transcript_48729/m.139364 type:complete len:522 (+) Transcript_48729:52-1617(+)
MESISVLEPDAAAVNCSSLAAPGGFTIGSVTWPDNALVDTTFAAIATLVLVLGSLAATACGASPGMRRLLVSDAGVAESKAPGAAASASWLCARGILPDPSRWKPFPWNWLPDPVALVWGGLEMLCIAPIAAVSICIVVPAMKVLRAIWSHPRAAPARTYISRFIESCSEPLGRIVLRDPRNHPYLPWMMFLSAWTPALFLWVLRRHARNGLELPILFLFHILRIGPRFTFFSHAHVLVHKEGHDHKGIFRSPFCFLNCLNEWWIAPFYGVVPNSYSIAHVKIHHRWHNDVDDVHTNLDLDRTLVSSFLIYTPRFILYWSGVGCAALLFKRKEWGFLGRLLAGMVAYYGVLALFWCWNPTFAFCYWLYPHLEATVALCAISYLWHAFVEESDPGNQYVNSVTVLDGHDNVWNEDFHVVHHHAPNCHWTDAKAHYEAHKSEYAASMATIFQDTEEGLLITMLFQKDYDGMARHFVDLNGKLSHEEKKALLIRRLKVIVGQTGRNGKRQQLEWGSSDTIRNFE